MKEQETAAGAAAERTPARKMSVVLKDAVLGRPLPDRSLEPVVLGATETCYLCHTHDDGEVICHEIVCPGF